jgi:ATP-binding cassette subfamily B protein
MRPHASPADATDRPRSRHFKPLLRLLRFTRPYLGRLLLALLALVVAAGALLAFGQVIRAVVDYGLADGSPRTLDLALLFFLGVVALLSVAIMARSYLLNWIGERVVADVRRPSSTVRWPWTSASTRPTAPARSSPD